MNEINLIEEFLYHFENSWEKDQKTIKAYKINLNEFKQYVFYNQDPTIEQLKELYPDDILYKWLNKVKSEQNLSVSSLNQRISSLRSMYDWLRKRRLISINTAKDIPLFKNKSKKEKRVLNLEECKLLLNKAEELVSNDKNYYTLRLRLAVNLFLAAGLRIEECSQLDISAFDRENNILNITKAKFDKQRDTHIPQQIIDMLDEYLIFRLEKNDRIDYSKHDYLFLSRKFNQLSTEQLRLDIYSLVEICGLDHIDVHSLRHAHSTLMANNGCPMHKLSNSIGHANINTTAKIYVSKDNEDISKYNPLYNNKEVKKENTKPKVIKEQNSNLIQIKFNVG